MKLSQLESDIRLIYNNYIHLSVYDIDIVQAMQDIFEVCNRNNLAVPKNMALLVKSMLTLEGVVSKLAPEVNIMELMVPT